MNVGFIGTGWADRTQINLYKKAGLNPYGVASRDFLKAEQTMQKHGLTKAYESWQKLIDDPKIDLVSIATPSFLHYEMLKYAIENDKHVICQAPFMDSSEIEELLKISKNSSKHYFIDFELRLLPQIQKIKMLIDSGELGEINWIELEYRNNFGLDASSWSWENDLSKGGGVMNIVSDHIIDLGLWLIGPIHKVIAQSKIMHHQRTDQNTGVTQSVTGDDHSQMMVKFHNGAQGTFTATSISAKQSIDILVHGSKGSLHLMDNKLLSNYGEGFPKEYWQEEKVNDCIVDECIDIGENLFVRGTYHFAKYLISNKLVYPATLKDALAMQQVLDKAHQSMKSGQWEQINE